MPVQKCKALVGMRQCCRKDRSSLVLHCETAGLSIQEHHWLWTASSIDSTCISAVVFVIDDEGHRFKIIQAHWDGKELLLFPTCLLPLWKVCRGMQYLREGPDYIELLYSLVKMVPREWRGDRGPGNQSKHAASPSSPLDWSQAS